MSKTYSVNYYLNWIGTKGRIAWEYNPLHNLRRTQNTDINGLHKNQIKLFGTLYTKLPTTNNTEESYVSNNGKRLKIKGNNYYIDGEKVPESAIIEDKTLIRFKDNKDDVIEAGSLVDMDTELLNFSLNNPVTIDAQPSYDGSVNLILNDNRNIPRLINTRFSTKQLNTYEIVDRIGDNDTNIYDDDAQQFDLDTSLYKRYQKIPQVKFNRVLPTGNLKVGNYSLYFKYCDADDNETDFVAESGIVAVFKGNDKDPFSIDGGLENMNAHKSIDMTLTNIDEAYDYVKVYYTRTSAGLDQHRQVQAYKLTKKFVVSHRQCHIVINGDEESELIPITELTSEYFIAETVKTQAQCQNMLFLGNVSRPDPLHQDLTDISLRILPYTQYEDSVKVIGRVNSKTYTDSNSAQTNFEYYNTKNIYYHVGYWNEEMYRFGIVYIMYDNTLSKVYNIRGIGQLPAFRMSEVDETSIINAYTKSGAIFDDEGNRNYIKVSEVDYSIIEDTEKTTSSISHKYLENARGVVRFNHTLDINKDSNIDPIYSIGIYIPEDVVSYLKNYCGIKGFFLVRQKRIPTILAQGLTLPIDQEAKVPMIYYKDENNNSKYYTESFLEQPKTITTTTQVVGSSITKSEEKNDKIITHDYKSRLCEISEKSKNVLDRVEKATAGAIICPEFEVYQSYYNQFFTGTDYPIKYSETQFGDIQRIPTRERFYTPIGDNATVITNPLQTTAKLVSVTEEVPTVAIGEQIFRGICGMAEEGFRFEYAHQEGEKTKNDSNLVRGIWHPYIGAVFKNVLQYGKIINIYIPGYNPSELANYFQARYSDNSPYYAIGDRVAIDNLIGYEDVGDGYIANFYRGDCYLCTFTHRLNRNFQDPSAPANDKIVDETSWQPFDPEDTESFEKINLGDINAVKMGSWYTFRVRSSTNLSIRSLNESYPEEKGIFGLSRGFYPLQQELISGNNKIPESYLINDGFRGTVSEKIYMRYPDVPYIKNNFENRILYSELAINDAFRNGYRVFKSTHFNDYSKEYGSIIKLVNLQSGLLCVFEHGIAYIPVNERAVAGEGAGGNVYINTSNVLPDNPKILSDMFGTQWPESVIQTPYFVYGLDTVGKKIWRTNGNSLEIISDLKLNKFLIDNITLGKKETTPIIGVRNVKSHYNANKGDVMFTFYDNQYGIEEKVWNLCYNEITNKFTTFYSWVPSCSENIDNIFFSFDRSTAKAIAKLGTSQIGSTNADGIILDCVVLDDNNPTATIMGLENRILPTGNVTVNIEYQLLEDPYGNYKHFTLSNDRIITWNRTDPPEEYIYIWETTGEQGEIITHTEEFTPETITKEIELYYTEGENSKEVKGLKTIYTRQEIIDYPSAVQTKQDILELEKVSDDQLSQYFSYTNENNEVIKNYTGDIPTAEQLIEAIKGYLTNLDSYCDWVLSNNIKNKKVWYLTLKANITVNTNVDDYESYKNSWQDKYLGYNYGYYISTIAVTSKSVFENQVKYTYKDVEGNYMQQPEFAAEYLTTDFWKHGQAGIIDIKDNILPCYWYGKQHPFEFEFVVRDTPNMHKIFDNLEIISNKCPPESFHFEVVGEQYEFAEDKRNMYYRQELTKEMWQKQGVDVVFDRNYTEITPKQNIKSTIFPLYYNRLDTFDEIYDSYVKMTGNRRDYANLSGSEIKRNKDLSEYTVITHIENTPIDSFTTGRKQVGRIRGNSQYKEDRWKIQIPSITFMQKNEAAWNIPPIIINYIPAEFIGTILDKEKLPNTYTEGQISTDKWTFRKEAKIRDKYLKVRVRYTGNELAIITAILTTYTESYA